MKCGWLYLNLIQRGLKGKEIFCSVLKVVRYLQSKAKPGSKRARINATCLFSISIYHISYSIIYISFLPSSFIWILCSLSTGSWLRMIVKIIVEWLALCGAAAEQVPGVYLWWVGVGDGEAPTWAHGPGTPVCHSTSAINNGINPTKGKMINLNKNYLDTRACLWISQQRPLLGSDWYFLFFIPPCHCYLWSTQWGCHATQSVVPAVLCSLYLCN